MINWLNPDIDATIFFPTWLFDGGAFTPAMLDVFFSRYTDQYTGLSTVHWEDGAHDRRRKASIFDGSMVPHPVYAEPFNELEPYAPRTLLAAGNLSR